jgi:methionyl aminopeptidase
MQAVKAATNTGIRKMGVDARLGEVGEAIEEVMRSYQCEYNGKLWDVMPIENLNGHNIAPYVIHGGKSVPIVKRNVDIKMEEGELYAIETFGSVMGRGHVIGEGECSHFALKAESMDVTGRDFDHKPTRDLLKFIKKRFGTIPFCRRWLDDEGQTRHLMSLKRLVDWGVVQDYPPLCEKAGALTAQYEHTILLRPTCKEILSRGTDF